MVRRGRFAPSPTGKLHFGSMVSAAASYLDARAASGEWLVRMEDVDTPRCISGAADQILRTLEGFGLHWDGPVVYQSRRTELYRAALDRLIAEGKAYGCGCSRVPGRYPGTCRGGAAAPRAWRVLTAGSDVEEDVGDFVVLRADGLFAYQLAVVVDDALQGITDVVRGGDLLDSTPRQIWLQRLLGYPTPRYLHTPVAVNAEGQKLSKQTLAPAVDPGQWRTVLPDALRFLGQPVPETDSLTRFWSQAVANWDPEGMPSAAR
ncbi:MAG: tRNA glutamyl-Q(34) synthetase GluQRS [Bryobacteraceae bacterium]|nr:tRNA glutamyl-Q(34) synthetase GluQRS [Bryobacteraceae bacterium]